MYYLETEVYSKERAEKLPNFIYLTLGKSTFHFFVLIKLLLLIQLSSNLVKKQPKK